MPSARPGILAGAVFAFITSWDEIVVTMFVTARHIFTLPRMIFEEIHDNLDPAVAAVSAMMMLVTVAVAGVLLWRDLRAATGLRLVHRLRGTPAAADKP